MLLQTLVKHIARASRLAVICAAGLDKPTTILSFSRNQFHFDCLIFSPQIYETVEMLQAEMVVAWSSIYDQELERILALLLQDVPGHKDEDAQNHPVNQEGGCLSGVCRE
jgi:hypothetical protein